MTKASLGERGRLCENKCSKAVITCLFRVYLATLMSKQGSPRYLKAKH